MNHEANGPILSCSLVSDEGSERLFEHDYLISASVSIRPCRSLEETAFDTVQVLGDSKHGQGKNQEQKQQKREKELQEMMLFEPRDSPEFSPHSLVHLHWLSRNSLGR
jgi:hypothetical protein